MTILLDKRNSESALLVFNSEEKLSPSENKVLKVIFERFSTFSSKVSPILAAYTFSSCIQTVQADSFLKIKPKNDIDTLAIDNFMIASVVGVTSLVFGITSYWNNKRSNSNSKVANYIAEEANDIEVSRLSLEELEKYLDYQIRRLFASNATKKRLEKRRCSLLVDWFSGRFFWIKREANYESRIIKNIQKIYQEIHSQTSPQVQFPFQSVDSLSLEKILRSTYRKIQKEDGSSNSILSSLKNIVEEEEADELQIRGPLTERTLESILFSEY